MDYEKIYRLLYEGLFIGATEDDKKRFAAEFDPDRLTWTDEEEFKTKLLDLIKKLQSHYGELLERFSSEDVPRGG